MGLWKRLLGRTCFLVLIGLTAGRVVCLDAWAQATAQIAGVVSAERVTTCSQTLSSHWTQTQASGTPKALSTG